MKKSLLIICQSQFGYHIDTYYYCKFLKNDFNITYLCWDYGFERIEMDEIDIKFVTRHGTRPERLLRYIGTALSEVSNQNYDIHFIKYFPACATLKILNNNKKFVLDIRSSYIDKKKIIRWIYNRLLQAETSFFKELTVVSYGLAIKLKIDKKAKILPLGADVISSASKTFESLKLLYVGTLSNRNIYQSLQGFIKFYLEYSHIIPLSYTIIGKGAAGEENLLRKIVRENNLSVYVLVLGQVPHDQLKIHFDTHNIGVSYVPITDYFNVQPVTKTFEYLLSGMPVIATNTDENRYIINCENGVLIQDCAEEFYNGLKQIYERRMIYDSTAIRNSSEKYHWEFITASFKKYLSGL